jgi:hypothetical protein
VFVLQFKEMATATLDSVRKNVMALPDVFGGLSNTVTTFAMATNKTWPYVTYPDWSGLGGHVRGLTNTMIISLVVNVNDPQKWIEYSLSHSKVDISPIIFELDLDGTVVPKMDGKDDTTVLWQMEFDPAYATGQEDLFYNFNFLALPYFNKTIHSIQKVLHGMLAPFMEMAEESGSEVADGMTNVTNSVASLDNPRGTYLTPVFDSLDGKGTIVAYIEAIIDWSVYFKKALLNRKEGIYCTVRNSCGEVHTWLLDGSGPRYVGPASCNAVSLQTPNLS